MSSRLLVAILAAITGLVLIQIESFKHNKDIYVKYQAAPTPSGIQQQRDNGDQ
jgi:hypothetical protein